MYVRDTVLHDAALNWQKGIQIFAFGLFFSSKLKHVQVTAMNIMLPFVQKWRLSIAAAAKIDSRHLIQCCTLPKKKQNKKHVIYILTTGAI